ncbi:hypothetical protein GCM10009836_60260 [Pseudonocardia ailaonensis]|uniref:DUF998 domain-containing protein n=1 Tax=Pseudonocardia ailaonensis TaxID=367279 RepID=A0ABN2NK70_9PSEU
MITRVGTALTGLATVYVVALLVGMQDPGWAYAARGLIHLAELAVLLGVVGSGAAGRGVLARIGAGLAGLGLVGMAVAEVLTNAAPGPSDLLFSIAPNLVGIGLILVGVAVIRAGVWSGWRRFVVLALGIVVFVVMTPLLIVSGGPPAPAGLVAVLVWEALWTLIGVAALTSPALRREPVPA